MATDLYTKVVLGVVAACLVLLVAQGFGLASGLAAGPPDAAVEGSGEAGVQERYRIIPVPMGRITFRVDIRTGETWKTGFRGDNAWTRIAEPGEAAVTPEPAESPPAE